MKVSYSCVALSALSVALVAGFPLSCSNDKPKLRSTAKESATDDATSTLTESQLLKKFIAKQRECGDDDKVWLPPLDSAALAGTSKSTKGTKTSEADDAGEVGEDDDVDAEAETDAETEAETMFGTCGAELITSYCCTLAELKTRFPKQAKGFETKIKDKLDEGLSIYSCSHPDDETTLVHMIKREDGETTYTGIKIVGAEADALALADDNERTDTDTATATETSTDTATESATSTATSTATATALATSTSTATTTSDSTSSDSTTSDDEPASCSVTLSKILGAASSSSSKSSAKDDGDEETDDADE